MNGLLDSPASPDILKKQNSDIIWSTDLTHKHVFKLCVDRQINLVTETVKALQLHIYNLNSTAIKNLVSDNIKLGFLKVSLPFLY